MSGGLGNEFKVRIDPHGSNPDQCMSVNMEMEAVSLFVRRVQHRLLPGSQIHGLLESLLHRRAHHVALQNSLLIKEHSGEPGLPEDLFQALLPLLH